MTARAIHTANPPALGVTSPTFIEDLAADHLHAFQASYGPSHGASLRAEIQAWAETRSTLAMILIEGHEDVATILHGAGIGAECLSAELITNSTPGEIEERHLTTFLRNFGPSHGASLRREILQAATARIEVAKTTAHGMVDANSHRTTNTPRTGRVPRLEPSRPLVLSTGAHEQWGSVASIHSSGALLRLESGDRGWLHVSELRVLNQGRRVNDVADVIRVGERVRVRLTGTVSRGAQRVELVPTADAPGTTDEGKRGTRHSATSGDRR